MKTVKVKTKKSTIQIDSICGIPVQGRQELEVPAWALKHFEELGFKKVTSRGKKAVDSGSDKK